MDELFLQLCGSVAALIEGLKPFLRKTMGVTDENVSTHLAYQIVIKLLAFGIGVLFAIGGQVDITPSWLATSDAVGYLFTGLLASLGSEVAHRILEIIRAMSGLLQNKANTQIVKAEQTSTRTETLTTTPADVLARG